jgi:mRNA interferase RelE/StbE
VPAAHFRLRIPNAVARSIRGLHPDLKRKVRAGLDALLADPHTGKPLRRDLSGLWSVRVGRLRIVYRIAAGRIVELVAVGPRSTIYEETYRLVMKQHPGQSG